MEKKKLTFEQALSRLEAIVSEMENGTAELDSLLSLFEEGVALVKQCKKDLDSAERKVKLVTGAGEESFPEKAE